MNEDEFRKWSKSLFSKNGFNVLSKFDKRVLHCLIDEEIKRLTK